MDLFLVSVKPTKIMCLESQITFVQLLKLTVHSRMLKNRKIFFFALSRTSILGKLCSKNSASPRLCVQIFIIQVRVSIHYSFKVSIPIVYLLFSEASLIKASDLSLVVLLKYNSEAARTTMPVKKRTMRVYSK